MRHLLSIAAMIALAACQQNAQQPASEATPAAEPGPQKGVDRSHRGQPFPDVKFLQEDGDGVGEMGSASFAGLPTLVNFWASWCAPCVKELPTLKALNESRKFEGFILPLNQDSGTQDSVRAFMAEHGVEELGNYQDPKMKVAGAAGIEVMPTTILYDANGKEVWRYIGELDWTGPEAAKLLSEAGGGSRKG